LRVPNANAALGSMVGALVESPVLMGLLSAGVLAAIMSSLDSQFVCLGTLFTNDVVLRLAGQRQLNDAQRLWLARGFIVAVVIVAYGLSMALINTNVFDLGVWCFTGFGALFPLVMAALYWRRATAGGAIACVLATAASWGYFFTQDIVLGRHGGEGEYLVMGMMPVAFIFAASALGMVLGSLLSKPMDPAHVERFFPPNPTQAPLYPSSEQPAAPPSTPIQPT
jgi:SSS family solute:Na+ symporter